MIDSFHRSITYLRLSLTDRCNLRCGYCIQSPPDSCTQNPLTVQEVYTIVKAAAALGINKIKLTGGEPLLRNDLAQIAAVIRSIPGVSQITLTTNGVLLKEKVKSLALAGIDGVNVSIDSAFPTSYAAITGQELLPAVISGIIEAKKHFSFVRLNSVILPQTDEKEVLALAQLAEGFKTDLRLIEMMPLGAGSQYPSIPPDARIAALAAQYGTPSPDPFTGNGPAKYLHFPKLSVRIGIISALHAPFCASCNRVRVTCTGILKPCLYYKGGLALRPLLNDESALIAAMRKQIFLKPKSHHFAAAQENRQKESAAMFQIGG